MTLDDQYLRRLDSLARFYNSQITAHVAYQISMLAIAVTAFFGAIAWLLGPLSSWDIRIRLIVGLSVFATVSIWLLLPIPLSLKYLLGATQYYQEMSYIVFEHMGLRSRNGNGNFETLKYRALWRRRKDNPGEPCEGMEGGITEAAQSLLEARLFVSKCQEITKRDRSEGLQRRLEHLGQRVRSERRERKLKDWDLGELKDLGEFLLKVFDVTAEERKVIIRDEGANPTLWYDKGIIFPTWLGYRTNNLLFLGHRQPSSPDRKTCLMCVFDC